MRSTPPLLCELHAHTTWSDGSLSVRADAVPPARRGDSARGLGRRRGRLGRRQRVRARADAPDEGGDDSLEDVLVERVLRAEVDGGVDLEHDVATGAEWEQVDADEVASDGGRGCDRELAGDRRRYDRLPDRAERDVCPPLARRGDAFDRSDDGAAGDDQAQVVAERRNQFLDEPAVRTEPPAA
jgi:hypothetical protein